MCRNMQKRCIKNELACETSHKVNKGQHPLPSGHERKWGESKQTKIMLKVILQSQYINDTMSEAKTKVYFYPAQE